MWTPDSQAGFPESRNPDLHLCSPSLAWAPVPPNIALLNWVYACTFFPGPQIEVPGCIPRVLSLPPVLLPGMWQNTTSLLPSPWHTLASSWGLSVPCCLLCTQRDLCAACLPALPLPESDLFREHFSLSVCLPAWLVHFFSFEKDRPGQDCWAAHGSHSHTGLLRGCIRSSVHWFILLAYFFFPLLPTF